MKTVWQNKLSREKEKGKEPQKLRENETIRKIAKFLGTARPRGNVLAEDKC